jgi:serine/threonine protein kinase
LEEEKKRFLYQLYYCLGLTKIFILNFKENKIPNLANEVLLTLNNKKNNKTNRKMSNKKPSTFSENSGIRFKTFYETFSNYSQIKLSSLEKFDNKSYPNIEIVNNYYIFKDKQIGKGGSSVVYLGEDDENHNSFAIKVTDKNLKANPFKHIYDYVKEEVSILKRIHSKYIVTTYEVIESKSRIYIIMEYMSLGPVNKMIDRIDENQIKQYTRNLICAVEHCHKIANIIHKDINVNNLLVNKDGIAKLCDFGISSVFEEDNDLLPSKGPSTYTPPEKKYNEQYRGKPADIYLIGLTLFHMVYKRPLFKDFGNLTKNDYINIEIPKKDENNKEINSDLYDLIKSMLSFNPDDRPTINKLKRDPWLTDQMKNPFPDVIKEALFYSLELTRKQIESLKNDESIDDDFKNIKQKNKVEEEETDEAETEEEEEEEEESVEEKGGK